MFSKEAKIKLGVVGGVLGTVLIGVGIYLAVSKPWEKNTAHPSSAFTQITTDADLDFLVFKEKMTYQETLLSCSKLKTHPIRVITRQRAIDFFKILYKRIRSSRAEEPASDEKILYWTGARFDLLSNSPHSLRISDNQTRSNLKSLEQDWCNGSSNYMEIIAAGLKKVEELKIQTKNRIILPQAIHVTLKYDPEDRQVCLHLFDRDVGINDPTKLSRITGACEARFAPSDPPSAKTNNTYYFPLIGSKNVVFSNALAQCKLLPGYTIAGLSAANPKILTQTVNLITNQNALAVWMGGFFNLSSKNPFLVHWLDGDVTDSSKAPAGVWCTNVSVEINELLKSHIETDRTLILPIVRWKKTPHCLSLYGDELSWQDKDIYPPLCITDRARIYQKGPDGQLLVPTSPPLLFDGLFNRNSRGFDNMQTCPSRGIRQGGTAIVHAHGQSNYIITSFRDTMPYNYTREFCKLVRSRNETTKGDMLTERVLDSAYIDEYTLSFNVYRSWLTFIEGYNETNRIALSTAGYFDFRERKYADDHTDLIWDTMNGVRIADRADLKFGWCNGIDPIAAVNKAYDEFKKWPNVKLTTGPNRVYVGVEVMHNGPCLRLVYDDLYWPGAYSWVPMCEKLKLPNPNFPKNNKKHSNPDDD